MKARKAALVAIVGAVLSPPALGIAADGAQPFRLDARTLEGMGAEVAGALVTTPLPTGPGGPNVLVVRRRQPGEVEVHESVSDVLVGRIGRGVVQIGGRAENQRSTGPGEWRGGEIIGAQAYPFGPGDVIWIPPGMPHKVTPQSRTFTYLTFKNATNAPRPPEQQAAPRAPTPGR